MDEKNNKRIVKTIYENKEMEIYIIKYNKIQFS